MCRWCRMPIRRRIRLLQDEVETDYTDLELVEEEMRQARRLFSRQEWPVIDVTRRSIEETAATIIKLLHSREAPEPENGETNGGG
jgi:regulator of PEP synthase PpsR (kinase-PPPase family)